MSVVETAHVEILLSKHSVGTKCSVKAGEREAVVYFVLLDALDSLLASSFRNVNRLDPRLDSLLSSELQQGVHLLCNDHEMSVERNNSNGKMEI